MKHLCAHQMRAKNRQKCKICVKAKSDHLHIYMVDDKKKSRARVQNSEFLIIAAGIVAECTVDRLGARGGCHANATTHYRTLSGRLIIALRDEFVAH